MEKYTMADRTTTRFYQLPKELFENPIYREVSAEAKVLYTMVKDRMLLSEKNKEEWEDENGNLYCYFSNESAQKYLNRSEPYIIKLKKELHQAGLILEVRQGVNKPNRIYPLKPKIAKSGTKNCLVQELNDIKSGTKNCLVQELNDIKGNDTEYNDTEYNDTERTNSGSTVGGGNTLYSKAKKISQEPTTATNEMEVFCDLLFENFGSYPSPLQIDDMKYMLEEHSLEVIKLAIKECVDYAKPNMSYMRTVLRNWKKAGLNTPELVKNRVKPRSTRGKVTMLDDGYDPKLGI
nr:MAG TPA: replication initiator protein [Bacteriophage sp.]